MQAPPRRIRTQLASRLCSASARARCSSACSHALIVSAPLHAIHASHATATQYSARPTSWLSVLEHRAGFLPQTLALIFREFGAARDPIGRTRGRGSCPRDGVRRSSGCVEDLDDSLVARLVIRIGELGREGEPLCVLSEEAHSSRVRGASSRRGSRRAPAPRDPPRRGGSTPSARGLSRSASPGSSSLRYRCACSRW